MNNPYDLHSWSKNYREEALHHAQTQSLRNAGIARPTPLSLLVVMLALLAVVFVASGCTGSAKSSVGEPSASSSTASSANESTSASVSPSAGVDANGSGAAAGEANASADQYADSPSTSPSAASSASASPSAPADSSGANAANFAGMRPSTSIECYTFYSDGTVELRHGGTSALSDSGSYQGDEDFGEIVWNSGR